LLTFASSIEIPGVPVRDDEDCEEFRPVESSFGAHHRFWIACLQRVADGEIKNLMGLMCPGSAKSTYSSVLFPTYFMGRFPGRNVIETSYGADLPRKFGRKARSIVRQKQYQRIFDTTLSEDVSAADNWTLTNGSEFMGAGILAGITGNRADGVIWDDLIKGREQADSKAIRDKTWDAYVDDLLSRKKPGAWEIGITTRWHEDDPAGRILPTDYDGRTGWVRGQDGQEWYVVCLPAICERHDDPLGRQPGDRIWPEWFGPDHFERFKRVPRTWASLYQQRPAPEEGDYFKADWLKTCERIPDKSTLRVYGASDYAVTAGGGDYTVHIVVGVDPDGRMYLLDLWRAQSASDVWVETFCDLVLKWKPMEWAEEQGQIKSGVGPFLERRMRERKAFVYRRQFPTRGDKAVRAQSIRGRMAMQGLYIAADAPWRSDLIHELLTFDAGTHDDQVDALGLIGQMLDDITGGKRPTSPDKKVDRWDRAFAKQERASGDNNWKAS
jgi:predicted phage terminase large subunit-like protein